MTGLPPGDAMLPVTVYVSIGNSDGKLSHAEWAQYYAAVNNVLVEVAQVIHGTWHSLPATPHVNACWCVEVRLGDVEPIKSALRGLAARFRQESIAWAPAMTEFLRA